MQSVKLNLIPGSVMPVVNVSQYDKARQFALVIYEGASQYSLTGKSVQIRGTKPDGNGFAYDSTDGVVSVSGNTVTISTTQQMTAVGGQTMAELRIKSGTTILGTINFILDVEHSALSDDTPISETEIPAIERDMQAAVDQAEAAAQTATTKAGEASASATRAANSATTATGAATAASSDATAAETKAREAATSATNAATSADNASDSADAASGSAQAASDSADDAADSAEDSEAYANGTRGGSDVPSTDPTYHNNAKYWRDQAASYAAGGIHFMGSIPFSDIPTVGMANGDMYNITDDFTTDSRFIEGAGVSVKAGADIAWVAGSVNKWDILALGGGSSDYPQLTNKPKINGHTLTGDQTAVDLGLASDAAMTGASAGSAGAKGLVPAPAAGDQDKVLYGDGTWKAPSGSSDMTGATSSTPGTHGLVPAPAAGDNIKFLRGDGTWAEAGGGGGGGFVLADWLTAGGLNPMSYADLAAVLADEKAVRKLMTIHLAVDYLAGQTAVDASINTILTDNTCAKWINLRDYALDTLYDNALFASIMDMSGKYFLGEWAKLSTSPETWGPKGNVPIMTSNTAPYGVASGDHSGSDPDTEAFAAFDGNDTFGTNGTPTNSSIIYKFVNPVCVKRFFLLPTFNTNCRVKNYTISVSNDGTNYQTLYTGLCDNVDKKSYTVDINNDEYYLYYKFLGIDHYNSGGNVQVKTLQFYGRELKVSVPVMTSNTAPYGVASADSELSENFATWNAFDNDSSTAWQASKSSTDPYLQYDFGQEVVVEGIEYNINGLWPSNTKYDVTLTLKGSNDGLSFDNVKSISVLAADTPNTHYDTVANASGYRYYRVSFSGPTYRSGGGIDYTACVSMQFYGENYSEYDWDAGNPRHYLYDHGVELETLYWYKADAGTVTSEKQGSQFVITDASTTYSGMFFTDSAVDFTSYAIMRRCYGNISKNPTKSNMGVRNGKTVSAAAIAGADAIASDIPYDLCLDVSSVSGSYYPYINAASNANTGKVSITEWWLE